MLESYYNNFIGDSSMKRIFLTFIILFLAGSLVYAQQAASTPPTADQTRQSAQQFISAGNTKSTQFDTLLDDFKTRNAGNDDASNFKRLSFEANQLEARINSEGAMIQSILNQGNQAGEVRLNRYEHLVKQYKAKLAEIEALISKE